MMTDKIPEIVSETFEKLLDLGHNGNKLFTVCLGLTWKVEGENLTFTKGIVYSPPSIGYVYVAEKENKSQIIYIGETGKAFGRFEMVQSTEVNFGNRERITNKRIKFSILKLLNNEFTVKVYFFIPRYTEVGDFYITIPSTQIETKLLGLYKENHQNKENHQKKPFINNFSLPIEEDYETKWEKKVNEFIGSAKCLKT